MSEDTLLAKQLKGTLYLIEAAREWERVADDEGLLVGIREYARDRAEAIRAELHP